jgi:hypothetical protein
MEFDKCPICLNNIKNNKKILNCICKKPYHNYCINRWLNNSITCPCCRYIVKTNTLIFRETEIFIIFYLFLLFILWYNILLKNNSMKNNKKLENIKNFY